MGRFLLVLFGVIVGADAGHNSPSASQRVEFVEDMLSDRGTPLLKAIHEDVDNMLVDPDTSGKTASLEDSEDQPFKLHSWLTEPLPANVEVVKCMAKKEDKPDFRVGDILCAIGGTSLVRKIIEKDSKFLGAKSKRAALNMENPCVHPMIVTGDLDENGKLPVSEFNSHLISYNTSLLDIGASSQFWAPNAKPSMSVRVYRLKSSDPKDREERMEYAMKELERRAKSAEDRKVYYDTAEGAQVLHPEGTIPYWMRSWFRFLGGLFVKRGLPADAEGYICSSWVAVFLFDFLLFRGDPSTKLENQLTYLWENGIVSPYEFDNMLRDNPDQVEIIGTYGQRCGTDLAK